MLCIHDSVLNNEVVDINEFEINTRSEFRQLTKQLFIQLRTKFLEYAQQNSFFNENERSDPALKLKHDDVVSFLRNYLKEFRPFTDMVVNGLHSVIFRIKQARTTEEEELKDEPGAASPKSLSPARKAEADGENVDQNGNNEDPVSPIQPVDDATAQKREEEDDDTQIQDPAELRKRFLFRCVCLQLYNSGLQISKTLHQFFDPEKKGYCSMSKCIFAFLNYYKIVMLPSDIRVAMSDFIMHDDKLDQTDDLFEYETNQETFNPEDAVTKVNYLEFLQEVARPYIYQIGKKELFITYQDFMKLLYKTLEDLLNICRKSLVDIYSNDFREAEINSFDKFSNMVKTLLGEEQQIPDDDCCQIFVQTFSAVDSSFHARQGIDFGPSKQQKYVPLHTKPVKVEEPEEDKDGETVPVITKDKKKSSKEKPLVIETIGEYSKDLPKGLEQHRAKEFAKQTECVLLNHFGMKYGLSTKLLKRSKGFDEILNFLQRESAGENVIKTKRRKSPKRPKSPNKSQ